MKRICHNCGKEIEFENNGDTKSKKENGKTHVLCFCKDCIEEDEKD
jgi:hypothetical protein